jgi:hypothetical protein
MGQVGGTLFFFGVGSAVLSFMDREFVILSWVDSWGPEIGWGIRGAMAVVGGGLWVVSRAGGR